MPDGCLRRAVGSSPSCFVAEVGFWQQPISRCIQWSRITRCEARRRRRAVALHLTYFESRFIHALSTSPFACCRRRAVGSRGQYIYSSVDPVASHHRMRGPTAVCGGRWGAAPVAQLPNRGFGSNRSRIQRPRINQCEARRQRPGMVGQQTARSPIMLRASLFESKIARLSRPTGRPTDRRTPKTERPLGHPADQSTGPSTDSPAETDPPTCRPTDQPTGRPAHGPTHRSRPTQRLADRPISRPADRPTGREEREGERGEGQTDELFPCLRTCEPGMLGRSQGGGSPPAALVQICLRVVSNCRTWVYSGLCNDLVGGFNNRAGGAPAGRSINRSIGRPADQSADRPSGHAAMRPTDPSTDSPVEADPPTCRPIDHPTGRTADRPGRERKRKDKLAICSHVCEHASRGC